MELSEYIKTVGVTELAKQLGCSKQLVSHWATGRQKPSPKMACKLEELSEGVVIAAKVRPDIFGGYRRDE